MFLNDRPSTIQCSKIKAIAFRWEKQYSCLFNRFVHVFHCQDLIGYPTLLQSIFCYRPWRWWISQVSRCRRDYKYWTGRCIWTNVAETKVCFSSMNLCFIIILCFKCYLKNKCEGCTRFPNAFYTQVWNYLQTYVVFNLFFSGFLNPSIWPE